MKGTLFIQKKKITESTDLALVDKDQILEELDKTIHFKVNNEAMIPIARALPDNFDDLDLFSLLYKRGHKSYEVYFSSGYLFAIEIE